MADRTVLDLTTDTPRNVIAIDGIPYPVRGGDDLTLDQYQFLERVTPRAGVLLEKLEKSISLTKAEGTELEALLAAMTPIALDAPPEVLGKLKALQRLMIFRTFMTLSTPAIVAAARAFEQVEGGSLLGGKPSPDSSGSTRGARRARGSRKHR